MPERQLRFLLALETFKSDGSGWREAGTDLLARTAGLSPRTVAKARDELVASGAIEYRRGGRTRGQRSNYRMPGIDKDIDQLKVAREAATFTVAQRWQPGSVKVANRPAKGGRRNAPTSANVSGALKESALQESALPAGARPVDMLRAVDPSVTEEESAEVLTILRGQGARDPVAVLRSMSDADRRYYIGLARHNID